ncbi:hypothetical protein LV82_00405 [Albidovulum inexpectatum]|uniref:Sulfotransferase family protein n=1 Tax=Albidovulum inexpectatum TaxID=196587 RepID=A0A2S5JM50_9RHOB|nr:hypothetical protein [Albidovulum inexpectatum]PPB82471.1 hypothetical protein LV82_00405 [Albidovulum inexpectatum]
MSARLLLHIGYHKTATSWMQQRLFVPEHGYVQIARHREVWDLVVAPHGLVFDPGPMRRKIAEGMASLPAGKVPVISSEILSGHPFYGGIGSDILAQRLKQIAPDARILISIRSQMSILKSVYMQYLSRGGTCSPETFFSGDPELGFHGFRPEHFEYHRLVGLYQDLFGRENVHVLTQEGLARDMDATAARLAEFAGNKEFPGILPTHRAVYAPSYPEYAVPLLRRLNKLQRSVLNPAPLIRIGTTPNGPYRLVGFAMRHWPFSSLLRNYRPVSDHVWRMFVGRFDDSNRQLDRLLQHRVDLSDFGIPFQENRDVAEPLPSTRG